MLATAIGVGVVYFLGGCLIQIHKGVLKKCPLKNDLKPTGSKAVPKKPKKWQFSFVNIFLFILFFFYYYIFYLINKE